MLLYLFFAASNTNAEIISKLSIEGNKRISEATIKVYGDIRIGKDYSEGDLDLILKKLYDTNFFEKIDLKLVNKGFNYKPKKYPIINQLVIIGKRSNKYKDQIKKIIKSKQKNSYIKSNIANDVNTIKSLYSSLGYNFAEVSTKIKRLMKIIMIYYLKLFEEIKPKYHL